MQQNFRRIFLLSGIGQEVHYHPFVRASQTLPLDTSLLKPGMRLAVGLSGGADSVALLCALVDRSRELGLVLHAAHLHHGLRGAEADGDLEFCRDLAAGFSLPFHEERVDTAVEARRGSRAIEGEDEEAAASDSIEGTARRLRYQWFRKLISDSSAGCRCHRTHARRPGRDRAREILARCVDGGVVGYSSDSRRRLRQIVRPLLHTTRSEIEAFLKARRPDWREDSTNRHLTFTRNRIRHELLPRACDLESSTSRSSCADGGAGSRRRGLVAGLRLSVRRSR